MNSLVILSLGACTAIIQNDQPSSKERGLTVLSNPELTVLPSSLAEEQQPTDPAEYSRWLDFKFSAILSSCYIVLYGIPFILQWTNMIPEPYSRGAVQLLYSVCFTSELLIGIGLAIFFCKEWGLSFGLVLGLGLGCVVAAVLCWVLIWIIWSCNPTYKLTLKSDWWRPFGSLVFGGLAMFVIILLWSDSSLASEDLHSWLLAILLAGGALFIVYICATPPVSDKKTSSSEPSEGTDVDIAEGVEVGAHGLFWGWAVVAGFSSE